MLLKLLQRLVPAMARKSKRRDVENYDDVLGIWQCNKEFCGLLIPEGQKIIVGDIVLFGTHFVFKRVAASVLRDIDDFLEYKGDDAILPFVFPSAFLGIPGAYIYIRDPFTLTGLFEILGKGVYNLQGYVTDDNHGDIVLSVVHPSLGYKIMPTNYAILHFSSFQEAYNQFSRDVLMLLGVNNRPQGEAELWKL